MFFESDWHEENFSYCNSKKSAHHNSKTSRKRKRQHSTSLPIDCTDENSLKSAERKLAASTDCEYSKICMSYQANEKSKLKSALKKTTSKKMKRSVSFADNRSNSVDFASSTYGNCDTDRQINELKLSKTNQKSKKKQKKKLRESQREVNKISSISEDSLNETYHQTPNHLAKSKVNTTAIQFQDAVTRDSPTSTKNKVSKPKTNNTKFSNNSCSKQNWTCFKGYDDAASKVQNNSEVCTQDDDEWYDCDDIENISDDEAEVQEFNEDVELDKNFHESLSIFIKSLNFADARKRMNEDETAESDVKQKGKKGSIDNSVFDTENSDNTTASVSKKEYDCASKQKRIQRTDLNPSHVLASLARYGETVDINASQKRNNSFETKVTNELQHKMMSKLNVARFRVINEQLYTTTGAEALKMFKEEPDSFSIYHQGFKSQVQLWPLNPLDVIVDWLGQQSKKFVVGDFGCGEAELSERVPQKVYSFDLVATKPDVCVCDMAHTPLGNHSLDVAVFCLSLMGTNVADFIAEANRTLKPGGILKIAEVKSRITNLPEFIATVQKFGFKAFKKPVDHNYFVILAFKKYKNIKNNALPRIILKPCLYKKR